MGVLCNGKDDLNGHAVGRIRCEAMLFKKAQKLGVEGDKPPDAP